MAKNGFILGHRGIGKKYYSISAVTLEDTTVCFLENDSFYEALKSDNELTYNLMLFYAEELRNAENRMKTLAQMTVKEKVAEALILAAITFGIKKDNNSIWIDAKLSRNDIAEIAGIRTEQFIRELTELKKENVVAIDTTKHIHINDIQYLKNMISTYYFENNDFL